LSKSLFRYNGAPHTGPSPPWKTVPDKIAGSCSGGEFDGSLVRTTLLVLLLVLLLLMLADEKRCCLCAAAPDGAARADVSGTMYCRARHTTRLNAWAR